MIYETKGLTLEEVDELYLEVSSARKSVGWKPTITWAEKKEKPETYGEKNQLAEHGEFHEQALAQA
jgi:hypothetical protein